METFESPPSHKSNIPNNTDMNGTNNSEHTKQNLSTDSNSNSTSISIQPSQPDNELWENWQEWDFITIHTGMNEKLKNTLIQFQEQNPVQWKLSNHSSGISGSLVNTVGQIFRCIHQLPLFKSRHYFSVATNHIGSIQVTYRLFHILLSGIKISTQQIYLRTGFSQT